MFLGILSVIALSVGTVQSVSDINESERFALQDNQPAIVQVIESGPGVPQLYPDLGL